MARTKKHAAVLVNAGEMIREARQKSGASQQAVADLFDWNRDAVSKIERGTIDISLFAFLEICEFLRDFIDEQHPALALYRALAPGRTQPRRP